MISAISDIFQHLKILKRGEYPLVRGLELLQAISHGLVSQLKTLLNSQRIINMDFSLFSTLISNVDRVFDRWHIEREKLREELRDLKTYRNAVGEFSAKYTELDSLQSFEGEIMSCELFC